MKPARFLHDPTQPSEQSEGNQPILALEEKDMTGTNDMRGEDNDILLRLVLFGAGIVAGILITIWTSSSL